MKKKIPAGKKGKGIKKLKGDTWQERAKERERLSKKQD